MMGILKQFHVLVTRCKKTSIAVISSLLSCSTSKLPTVVADIVIIDKTLGTPCFS